MHFQPGGDKEDLNLDEFKNDLYSDAEIKGMHMIFLLHGTFLNG